MSVSVYVCVMCDLCVFLFVCILVYVYVCFVCVCVLCVNVCCVRLCLCVCVCLVCFVCVNVCIYFYVLRAHSPSVSVLQTGVNLNLPLVGTVDIYDSLTNTMCVISCDAHNSATYKQTSCPVLYTHTQLHILFTPVFRYVCATQGTRTR